MIWCVFVLNICMVWSLKLSAFVCGSSSGPRQTLGCRKWAFGLKIPAESGLLYTYQIQDSTQYSLYNSVWFTLIHQGYWYKHFWKMEVQLLTSMKTTATTKFVKMELELTTQWNPYLQKVMLFKRIVCASMWIHLFHLSHAGQFPVQISGLETNLTHMCAHLWGWLIGVSLSRRWTFESTSFAAWNRRWSLDHSIPTDKYINIGSVINHVSHISTNFQ